MSKIQQTSTNQTSPSLEKVSVIPSTTGIDDKTDSTAYRTISPTLVTQITTGSDQPLVRASAIDAVIPTHVASVSSSEAVSSSTQPLPDQLLSSLSDSPVISTTSVTPSFNITSSFVNPTSPGISSVVATSSYSDSGSSPSVYLRSSESSYVTAVSATPPLQTSYSRPPVSNTARILPPPSTTGRATTIMTSSAAATESLTSSWATVKSSISPSSTFRSLFTSATATSSVLLAIPATTTSRKPIYNTTFELPEPASKTESLYIVIPVCVVVLLMLAILIIMCLRWRKQVKKVYEEPPPDLWVNSHTEMSILPPASTTPVPTIPVDNIAPFLPGDSLCCAIHPFPAQLDMQLSLKEGDVVKVLDKEENGWWRGVNQAGDSGWFPGSYVEIARYVPNLTDEKKKASRVSSFLLKKRSYFSNKNQIADNTDSLDTANAYKEEQLHTDKIAASAQLQNNKIENGTKYSAVYSYTAASKGEINLTEGEVVIGYERDRNGWMRGRRVKTGEEGWFPAVYVEEIHDAASLSSESTISGPVSYDQLTRNRNYHQNQDWIGLEHRACYSYVGQVGQDLSFEAGDKIIIYEILDNGWWLGSKGKKVGWLPGTYVQLVESHTDDEARSDSSADDKFKSSSEDLVRSDDDDKKPKPGRKAPRPPTHQTSSARTTLDKQNPAQSPIVDESRNEDQTTDEDKMAINRGRPIKFQRLSSDPVRPLRRAPAPPSQRSSTELAHPSVNNTNNTELPDTKILPEYKPPSPENFVTVKVELPSRISVSNENIFPSKKPQVPKRFAKQKLHIRRKSTKLTKMALHSIPSRPVPPRPPQPVFNHRYRKKKTSREYSPVDDKMSTTSTDFRSSEETSISNQHRISTATLPPDIVLSSSGDTQYNTPVKRAPPVPLPSPPSPEELDALTTSPSTNASMRSNISRGSLLSTQFKPRRVIKVPPPVVPQFTLENPTKKENVTTDKNQTTDVNLTKDENLSKDTKTKMVTNSESQNNVIPTHSEEENNLRNKNSVEEKHSTELEENHKEDIIESSITIPEPESTNGHLSDENNSKDTHTTSNKEHSNVENEQKSEIENEEKSGKENEQSPVANKPKYRVPPVKPPPPKSPPPKVQRLVRNMEANNKSKPTTLWRAKRNYTAAAKGELSFEEGTFIKEISKALGHPGWCVGMLADGTTGLYHQSYVEESLVKEQTHI